MSERATPVKTRNLMVQVCTTYWDRETEKYCHFKGWPGEGDPLTSLMAIQDMQQRKAESRRPSKPVAKVSLYQALTYHCDSSAYFVQYAPTSLNVRFKTGVFATSAWELLKEIEPGGINMILAIFDVDCHKTRKHEIDTWFNEQRPKIAALHVDHPGILVYRSTGGMRLLGVLRRPLPMDSFDTARSWTRLYGGWCTYLARKYDIKTEGSDTADQLGDWTRFQRVPHDKRHKNDQAANLEIIGDVEEVGVWDPDLVDSDYPEIRRTSKSHSDYSGECQLLSLVRRTGLTCEETQLPNAYDIHCPDHMNHGTDLEYRTTMTYLYTDGPIGRLECKSSTCQRRHPDKGRSYLECFRPDDVVATTSVYTSDDPIVERIWERILNRQEKISFDEPQDSPLCRAQDRDQALLLKAIRYSAYPDTLPEMDKKAFTFWLTQQKHYKVKDLEDRETYYAFLVHIDKQAASL